MCSQDIKRHLNSNVTEMTQFTKLLENMTFFQFQKELYLKSEDILEGKKKLSKKTSKLRIIALNNYLQVNQQ